MLAMPRMALPRYRLLSRVIRGRESARIQPRSCRLELSSPTVRGRGNSEGQAQPFVGGALAAMAKAYARSRLTNGRQDGRTRRTSIVMNNLKRFTVCKLAGHKWLRVAYPPGADGEDPETFFARCRRCGKENHNVGTVPGPLASGG